MKKLTKIIAIDPDTAKSGVATLEVSTRKLTITTLEFPRLIEHIRCEHELSIVNNQTLIAQLVKQAEGEVQDHIRSLNIDLDCSLTDYYAQMENMRGTSTTTTVTSGGVQFNLDISDSTFEKYEDYAKAKALVSIMAHYFKVLGEYKNTKP